MVMMSGSVSSENDVAKLLLKVLKKVLQALLGLATYNFLLATKLD